MRSLIVFVSLLVLSGCTSLKPGQSLPLGPEWRPLKEIRERPPILKNALDKTAITTVGENAYVQDLAEWLGRTPLNSPKFKAILRHEQEHSRRQLKAGTFLWIAKYSYDKKFALKEELIGYYYEITERRRLGDNFNPANYAVVLSNYKILTDSLINHAEALA